MNRLLTILFSVAIVSGVLFSCAKYKDPKGVLDPRLATRHYCNDPLGVNYNWDFPGVPDNSLCFYPTDVFAGRYLFRDSIYFKNEFRYIRADSIVLTITRSSMTKMMVAGFCVNGGLINMTALPSFVATVDTTVGDTLSGFGQLLCGGKDTLTGTISQNRIDSTLTINFQIASDTGVTTLHVGTGILIK